MFLFCFVFYIYPQVENIASLSCLKASNAFSFSAALKGKAESRKDLLGMEEDYFFEDIV